MFASRVLRAWTAVLWLTGAVILLSWLWIAFFWNLSAIAMPHSNARVLLVGDPQIMASDGTLHGHINQHFNDWYMRYILWRALRVVQPTHVVVLGDIFSFQFLSDDEWDARVQRYRWIVSDITVPIVNISGNHDIGYSSEQGAERNARWERDMGPLNGELALSDAVKLVWMNSMVLDGAFERAWSEQAWAHVERPRREAVLLVTHIPLHKPAGSCPGDEPLVLRSGDAVAQQNLLTPESSARLLRTKPEAIFRYRQK